MFSSYRYFLTAASNTLPMMLKTDLKPPFVNYVMFSIKLNIVDASIKYFICVSRIAFGDQLYSTKIAVFCYIDMIGNFLVKSHIWCHFLDLVLHGMQMCDSLYRL